MSADTDQQFRTALKRYFKYAAFLTIGYLIWKADVLWNYYQFKRNQSGNRNQRGRRHLFCGTLKSNDTDPNGTYLSV